MQSQGPGAPAPQLFGALAQLGKGQALLCVDNLFSQDVVRLCEYDCASHQQACQVSAELPDILQRQDGGTTETCSEAHMATPIRLLYMRPLATQRVPRWAWHGGVHHGVHEVHRTFSTSMDLAFLQAGVPIEQVSLHVIVMTDASTDGLGRNGQAASGSWTGPHLLWHNNFLELLAVLLVLRKIQPLLLGKHMLVHNDPPVHSALRLSGAV